MIRPVSVLLLALCLVPAVAAAQAAPSPAQLGVPVYPGSSYDARNSEGMSQPTTKYYIFRTADSLARVVRFYENATKHQGSPLGDRGAVMIVLAGKAPFPTHGIMIEPNRKGMYPASVRTVITVIRAVPSPAGH
jgi:hypothetical protein